MCGRYVSARTVDVLAAEFGIREGAVEAELAADHNVAPTKPVYAVLVQPGAGERRLAVLRWGLVPAWARDPSQGARLVNARAETAGSKPAFRAALERRRCLLPADGWYEWHGHPGLPRRQPYFVHPDDGRGLAFAGLYESWRDPTRDPADPAAVLRTCTVVTTEAPEPLAWLHGRAPLVLPVERWEAWLDRDRPGAPLLAGARTRPDGWVARAVDPRVGDARENDPRLLDPVPAPSPAEQPVLF